MHYMRTGDFNLDQLLNGMRRPILQAKAQGISSDQIRDVAEFWTQMADAIDEQKAKEIAGETTGVVATHAIGAVMLAAFRERFMPEAEVETEAVAPQTNGETKTPRRNSASRKKNADS